MPSVLFYINPSLWFMYQAKPSSAKDDLFPTPVHNRYLKTAYLFFYLPREILANAPASLALARTQAMVFR